MLLPLLALAACGTEPAAESARPREPLDSVKQRAVGIYALDMETHVPRDPAPLRSMRIVLREDRTFSFTCWNEPAGRDITATGSWSIGEGKLIRVSTAYHATNDPSMPEIKVPRPRTDEWIYENEGFRVWPHRPYLLRRID